MIQWNSGAVGAYAKLPFHRRQNKRQAEFQAPRSAKPCNLSWNHRNDLGAPIQLIQGNRYMMRWLAQQPAAVGCGAILDSVNQAINQASSGANWPWQNLVAANSAPGSFPTGMTNFPFSTPGFCPLWIDGVWDEATTPVVDSKDLPGIPGLFNTDVYNANTGQRLVEVPRAPNLPTGLPCNPAELAFDPVTGIFKCAGQIMTSPGIPSPQTPNQCPAGQVRLADGTCGPASGGGSGTKTEEKSSVLPWVIGGGVVLLGGAYLLTR